MPADVIALRTREFDGPVRAWAERLAHETGLRVIVVADETRREIQVPAPLRKIVVSRVWARSRGLHAPANALWRCGDYCLYAVHEAVPDAARVWLLDDDVRIHTADLGRFFDPERAGDPDLLAAFYRPAGPDWAWFEAIRARYETPYRCWFPIVRVSAEAISSLFRERVALSRKSERAGLPDWPNDESFVATHLTDRGFRCLDLNDWHPPGYNSGTFSWRERPFSGLELGDAARDGLIYHPVRSGRDYLAAMRRALRLMRDRDQAPDAIRTQFGRTACDWIGAECGAAAARVFAAEVRAAVRAAATTVPWRTALGATPALTGGPP